jgi:alpha 1,6-mannosyltransferase
MTCKEHKNIYSKVLNSWTNKNQGYDLIVYNDKQSEELVKTHLSKEIYVIYMLLPKPVMKADMFRYIVLYINGGTYTDTDTLCVKPISSWSDGKDVDMVIAIESYKPNRIYKCSDDGFARNIQFIQWSISSAKNHPILLDVINKIKDITPHMMSKSNLTDCDILNWTGPGIWCDSILSHIGDSKINVKGSTYINGVYVLPRIAFSAGDVEYNYQGKAQHLFWGSWKGKATIFNKIYQNIERIIYLYMRC